MPAVSAIIVAGPYETQAFTEFKTKYTIYRLGSGKGFRVVGQIAQDLDLFRMPVDLKIETEGNPEEKRVEVVGTSSEFSVDTFGKPRSVVIDPNNRVLKNSGDLRLRSGRMPCPTCACSFATRSASVARRIASVTRSPSADSRVRAAMCSAAICPRRWA